MPEFLRTVTPDELMARLERFARLPVEPAAADASLLRIVAEDVPATEDLPPLPRSTVDGFAVRAADTFGASDSIPALLVTAAPVAMGTVPEAPLLPGQAAPIPTGGFLPRGADAVVMVEYTAPAGGGGVEVYKPVTAGSNVLAKGDDVRAGETVVAAGRILRPQELGLLAALGITTVRVYRPPVAAVVSTGDEIVPAGGSPRPGQVRDANGPSVASLLRASGCRVAASGIVPDNAAALERALRSGLDQADLVVLSGGSSVGLRDLMAEVVAGLDGAEILAHGVSIRPGKPTLLARRREQAIFGLPGHPVSALLVAHAFLVPFVKYLQGGPLRKGPLGERRRAILASPVASTIGLEEYVRVSVEEQAGGGCLAAPVFGNSGMLSTLVKADSVVVVPMNSEGIGMGETVEVIRLS